MIPHRTAFTLIETLAALVLLGMIAVEAAGMIRSAAVHLRLSHAPHAPAAALADTADRLLANPDFLETMRHTTEPIARPAPDEPVVAVRVFVSESGGHAWIVLERDGATACRWLPLREPRQ